MDDNLLSYYNRELAYLRRLGAEFSEQHPKIAGRIRLDGSVVEDPHVSRLLESFAFLTARIRRTLDDSYPELTEALMGLLNPNFYAPVPSYTIMRAQLAKTVLQSKAIPASCTLYSDVPNYGRCYYRTLAKTWVMPMVVTDCFAESLPLQSPMLPAEMSDGVQVQSAMQVDMVGYLKEGLCSFPDEVTSQPLRFFIHAQPQIACKLYEYLFHHLLAVGVVNVETGQAVGFLPPTVVQASNFTSHEDDRDAGGWHSSHDGRDSVAHTLLSDLFACPQLFLFFEISELAPYWSVCANGMRLVFYFSDVHSELVQGVVQDTLQLGCTPAINLFQTSAHTVNLASHDREAKLLLDRQAEDYGDIQHIKNVYLYTERGDRQYIPPLYGAHQKTSKSGLYWVLRRESSQYFYGEISHGTDCYLSLVDDNYAVTERPGGWQLEIEAVCNNRDLPLRLPFGPDEPKFSFFGKEGGGMRLKCLMPPSPTLAPRLKQSCAWALVTQLSLQSFSGESGLSVLKQTLRLYDRLGNKDNQSIIDGILKLEVSPGSARLRQAGRMVFCSGTRLHLTLDEHYYSGSGVYLFGAVLNEFFSQFCALNSFTQLTIKVQQRTDDSYSWPPRAGSRALL